MTAPHLYLVRGRDNTHRMNLRSLAGAPRSLSGKSVRAVFTHSTPVVELVLASGSPGVEISDAAAGEITLVLTAAQVNAMPVDEQATLWLSIFNADGTHAVAAEPHGFLVRR